MYYKITVNDFGDYIDENGQRYDLIECNKCVYGVQHNKPDNYGLTFFESKEDCLNGFGIKYLSLIELDDGNV